MTVIDDVVEAGSPALGENAILPVRQRAPGEESTSSTMWHDGVALRRILAVIAVLGLFGAAFATWTTTVQIPLTGAISALTFGAGLVLVIVAIATKRQRTLAAVEVGVVALAALVLVGWTVSNIYFQPGYGTDEAAFEQYAAQLLVGGHNPYGADLLPALSQFRVPIQYATYTMNGGIVHQLGYPSLPVLLTASLLPITHGIQTVVIVNVTSLLIALVVMARLLPRSWRSLAPITVVGLPLLFGYAVSGVNAILMMTALIGAAHRWHTVGSAGRLRRGDVARAICLGLAVSVQQLAWFVAPFVVVGIYLARRGTFSRRISGRVVLAYVAIATGVFVGVNAPFIAWSPRSWLLGIIAPLTQHAIPYGQGLIDFTLFLHVGGGALGDFTIAGAAGYLGLLGLYAFRFRTLGRACFVLPSLALFLPTRSLAEYFMTLAAVWVVAIATAERADFDSYSCLTLTKRWPHLGVTTTPSDLTAKLPHRLRNMALLLLFAPAALFVTLGVTSPAPLKIQIEQARSTGQLQSLWKLQLRVTNHSGDALSPHFAVNYIGQATTFYNVLSGPDALPAHATATYVIAAPNRGSMPGLSTPFLVQAVTGHPETISSSALFTPQQYQAVITPGYVNQVLKAGQSVTLHVNLRSPFGEEVHQAGVMIALGQLIYAQGGLVPGEARINDGRPGQTPIIAVTDATGTATFRLRDDTPQDRPIYFQAYIQSPAGFPFGYSDIIPVLWAS